MTFTNLRNLHAEALTDLFGEDAMCNILVEHDPEDQYDLSELPEPYKATREEIRAMTPAERVRWAVGMEKPRQDGEAPTG